MKAVKIVLRVVLIAVAVFIVLNIVQAYVGMKEKGIEAKAGSDFHIVGVLAEDYYIANGNYGGFCEYGPFVTHKQLLESEVPFSFFSSEERTVVCLENQEHFAVSMSVFSDFVPTTHVCLYDDMGPKHPRVGRMGHITSASCD